MDNELTALLGEWDMGGKHPDLGPLDGLGQLEFEWMTGEQWLIQRWHSTPPFPSGVAVIGPVGPEAGGRYTQHYFDSRGVARAYEMTLSGGVWTLERRDDDDFWQRFRAEVSADEIRGAWEKADPGEEYELDFEVLYRRR